MSPFITLMIAIVSEVIATASLRTTEGFTKPLPSVIVIIGYASAFYFLSLTLKSIPVGTAYAIWSGLGTAATVAIGVFIWRESFDLVRFLGIALIIAGVVVLNVFGGGTHTA